MGGARARPEREHMGGAGGWRPDRPAGRAHGRGRRGACGPARLLADHRQQVRAGWRCAPARRGRPCGVAARRPLGPLAGPRGRPHPAGVVGACAPHG
eukprot:9327837-Lingulodinium_polyedra.AAC.1